MILLVDLFVSQFIPGKKYQLYLIWCCFWLSSKMHSYNRREQNDLQSTNVIVYYIQIYFGKSYYDEHREDYGCNIFRISFTTNVHHNNPTELLNNY